MLRVLHPKPQQADRLTDFAIPRSNVLCKRCVPFAEGVPTTKIREPKVRTDYRVVPLLRNTGYRFLRLQY